MFTAVAELLSILDLEQIEDAPEYDPNIVLTTDLVKKYLMIRVEQPA